MEKISPLFSIVAAALLSGIGFLIKYYLFNGHKKREACIRAGGDIIAGRDIIIGSQNQKCEPDLYISPIKKHDYLYAEIFNTGNEDISNLNVVISWKQKGKMEDRNISEYFFNANEDPVFNYSHRCEYIRKGEKKIISSLPLYSDDGEILFKAKGMGVKSKKNIEKIFILKNTIKLDE